MEGGAGTEGQGKNVKDEVVKEGGDIEMKAEDGAAPEAANAQTNGTGKEKDREVGLHPALPNPNALTTAFLPPLTCPTSSHH